MCRFRAADRSAASDSIGPTLFNVRKPKFFMREPAMSTINSSFIIQ